MLVSPFGLHGSERERGCGAANKRVRHHDEAATRIGCLRGDNAFDLILVVNWSGTRLDGKG
jgi:hypothetical protein